MKRNLTETRDRLADELFGGYEPKCADREYSRIEVWSTSRDCFKAGFDAATKIFQERERVLRDMLTKGEYDRSVREKLALMAEGEGSDWRVYQEISKAALDQVDQALASVPEVSDE